jgi:antitoxin ParD1/3/4
MNVNLTPQLEQLVKQKVETGLYNNASEVIREALRLMALRDGQDLLRAEAAKGLAQLRAGKTVSLDMKRAKRTAKANAKKARPVNPLVTDADCATIGSRAAAVTRSSTISYFMR